MRNNSASAQALLLAVAVVTGAAGGYFAARTGRPAEEAPVGPKSDQIETRSNSLTMSPADVAAAGIKTEEVRPGDLSTSVIAPAMVDAEIRGEGMLTAHVPGTVVQINNRLGDRVQAGDTLALVESPDAAALAAARDVAESHLTLARSILQRETSLYEQMVTPRQDMERAQADVEAAEAETRRARAAADAAHVRPDGRTVAVTTPVGGMITSRTAELGQYVRAETELFRVSDPKYIDIDAAVTVQDAQRIRAGDRARVTTRAGVTADAVVRSVSPTVNEQTRTANVVLDPVSPITVLTPGELVQAEIMPRNAANYGAVVPDEAIQNVNGRSVVFVRTQAGFSIRPVVVGARSAGMDSITSGLNPGETIATANAFLLKAELGKGAGEDE